MSPGGGLDRVEAITKGNACELRQVSP